MIASLPMYWRAQTAPLWRAFWALVQEEAGTRGLDLPELTAPEDLPPNWYDHWLSPDLALSMTCGLPFRAGLKGLVGYVGSIDFGFAHPAGYYFSIIIGGARVRQRPRRLAYNNPDSQSGWGAQHLPAHGTPRLPFDEVLETGSHAESLAAVAEGRADMAFIDAASWRVISRLDPRARTVQVIGNTGHTPGLPFITARENDPEPLFQSIEAACARFETDDPMRMGGRFGITRVPLEDYYAVPIPDPPPGHPVLQTPPV